MLTKENIAEYKKLYRRHLKANRRDRDIAHILALFDWRGRFIMAHPAGWWTTETRDAVMAEIAEIEKAVR